MKILLAVHHTMTGGTLQMVDAAVRAAAAEEGVRVLSLPARAASASDMLQADGYLFATPENLAAMSGQLKDFFDRIYYASLDRVNGRPYASLICAGSDGANAARQIERIATGLRLRAIAPPLVVCTHAQTKVEIERPKSIAAVDLQRCADIGQSLAAGLALGIF